MRSLLSYCVHIEHFDEYCLKEMKNTARELYISCCLYGQRNSPSLWTLCNIAPIHAEMCLKLYGMGLGVNTTEGREQKHQMIKQYSENTTFQNKWPIIFCHEFVQLVVLREQGFDDNHYRKRASNYVPDLTENACEICRAIFIVSEKCKYCDGSLFLEIVSEVKKIF